MNWQILLLVSIFSIATATILQRKFLKGKEYNPVAFSLVFQVIASGVMFIYAFFRGFGQIIFWPVFLNVVLMAFLYSLGNIFKFKSLKEIEASQFTIVFQSKALWSIIFALIFLGESFSYKQGLGFILIILATIIVTADSKKFEIKKGIIWVFIAALVFGTAFGNDGILVKNLGVSLFLILVFLLPGLFTLILSPGSAKDIPPLLKKDTLPKISLTSFFYAIAAIAVYEAYNVGRNISQIAPIQETVTIVTVILAMIFLGERSHPVKKLLGAVISVVGVLLLK